MQQYGNTFIGFASGIFGGIGSFVLDIKIGLLPDMLIAIVTAILCGAAGVAGKEGYLWVKNKIKNKRNGIKGKA